MSRKVVIFLTMASVMVIPNTYAGTIGLYLSDGTGNFVTVTDGDDGSQANHAPDQFSDEGVVTFMGGIGNWIINVTTGEASSPGTLSLTSFNVTSAGAGTLTILFSQDGLTTNFGAWALQIGGTNFNTSASYDAWIGNALFDTTTQIAVARTSDGNSNLTGADFSATGIGSVTLPPEYSLTQRIQVSAGSNDDDPYFSAGAQLTPSTVPEPTPVVLLGIGLVGIGILGRYRSKLNFGQRS